MTEVLLLLDIIQRNTSAQTMHWTIEGSAQVSGARAGALLLLFDVLHDLEIESASEAQELQRGDLKTKLTDST